MKKILLLIVLVTNVTFAQDFTKKLDEFKSLTITSEMDVDLILSDHYEIQIHGNDIDNLTIENEKLELKLSSSISKKFKSDLKVKIFYKEGLRYIKLANYVKFKALKVLDENFLEFEAVNNVKAEMTLKTVDFSAKLSLGSNLLVSGVTETQNITVNTKGLFDGFNLKSKKAFVEVSAAQAGVYVTEFLDANAKLKGEIKYMGKPNSVNQKTFLGKVIPKEN